MCSRVPTYSQCQIPFCYTGGFIYAVGGMTVPPRFFCTLYRTAPANLDVWYNLSSQTLSIITRSRIARHGYAAPSGELPVCVAEHYLALRIGYEKHGRKNPLPYSFSKRSHVGNLCQIRKQGKGRSPKRKGNRRCPFLFAPRPRARQPPALRRAQLLA